MASVLLRRYLRLNLRTLGYRGNFWRFLDGEKVSTHFAPFAQHQSLRGEVAANLGRIPAQHFFQHRSQHAHGVVAEHRAPRDARDVFRFADGDGQTIVLVDVHHHWQVRAAVTHVNNMVVADAQLRANFFQHRDLAPAGGRTHDGLYFAVARFVIKLGAVNILRLDDAGERRLNNFLWRGREGVEVKLVALRQLV